MCALQRGSAAESLGCPAPSLRFPRSISHTSPPPELFRLTVDSLSLSLSLFFFPREPSGAAPQSVLSRLWSHLEQQRPCEESRDGDGSCFCNGATSRQAGSRQQLPAPLSCYSSHASVHPSNLRSREASAVRRSSQPTLLPLRDCKMDVTSDVVQKNKGGDC